MSLRLIERARVADRVQDPKRLRFLIDVLVAVAGIRVIAQPLGAAGPTLLLDRFEHVRRVARVVPGARHDLSALKVGLLLVLAAELQEVRADAELRPLGDDLSPRSADDGPEDGAGDLPDARRCLFAGLRGPV